MKRIIFLVGVLGIAFAALTIYNWRVAQITRSYSGIPTPDFKFDPPPPPEKPEQTLWRFRGEADALARNYVSNEVVGFRRLRHISINNTSDAVTNWTGQAEAEYINPLGGVSLKTVDFAFYLGRSGKILYVGRDYEKQIRDMNAEFWGAFTNKSARR